MKPATYKKLLRDLQKLQKKLVTAYEAEVRASPERMAWVTAHWKAAEVGGRVDTYLDVVARRSAVQFILRTVYTRVLEDLGALTPPRIRGQWGLAAFKEAAPSLGLRGYLRWVFRDLAKDFRALFTPGPDELPLPNEDLVREVWELWHREDGKGGLVYGWQADDAETGGVQFDSRFLGDLYQDLDREVRKRFALLQTPVFVEEYILDHTLTPALAEFDPAALRDQGETFRLIDPTCGSGHFLIGAFHRLADWWQTEHGCDVWTAATRALGSVWGADLNPHAVDIARFRLLLEVRERTGETSLDKLASLPLNLAVMDSLIPWERLQKQPELFPERDRLAKYATAEERAANAAFLGRDFHVVVGNPPYVPAKDPTKRDDYRAFWPKSIRGKYALSAPFVERLFDLTTAGGFQGQITSNSFAKRGFGSNLVEVFLPTVELTRVVDTSRTRIPGHTTPTVMLFGRNHSTTSTSVTVLRSLRGDSTELLDPSMDGPWQEILSFDTKGNVRGSYISSALVPREDLGIHPWSLEGGAAPALLKLVDESGSPLEDLVHDIGYTSIPGEDDIFENSAAGWRREGIPLSHLRRVAVGEAIRDFAVDHRTTIFPYDSDGRHLREADLPESVARYLWRFRTSLKMRVFYGKLQEERRLPWFAFAYHKSDRFSERGGVVFPLLASHGHMAFLKDRAVVRHSASVIDTAPGSSEAAVAGVVGGLSSSLFEFWCRQKFYKKGSDEEWSDRIRRDATTLKKFPTPDWSGTRVVSLGSGLVEISEERDSALPSSIFATDWNAETLRPSLDAARIRYAALTHRMVALQEELDWLTYGSYGLLDDVETIPPDAIEPLSPGHRPFEILAARADEDAPPEEKSAWWDRHGHPKVTEIPASYSAAHRARIQARMDLIEGDDKLQLLETFPFKRRWQLPDLDKESVKAAEDWLLDRLEDLFAAGGALSEPTPYRLEEIVAAWTADPRVAAAAAVFEGTTDVDLTLVAEKLLAAESLPDNPWRLYAESGLRKLDQWKEVWALQDREDAGEDERHQRAPS